jgi:hypothetical protein
MYIQRYHVYIFTQSFATTGLAAWHFPDHPSNLVTFPFYTQNTIYTAR